MRGLGVPGLVTAGGSSSVQWFGGRRRRRLRRRRRRFRAKDCRHRRDCLAFFRGDLVLPGAGRVGLFSLGHVRAGKVAVSAAPTDLKSKCGAEIRAVTA